MTSELDPAIATWLEQQAQAPTATDTSVPGQRIHSRAVNERSRARLGDVPLPAAEEDIRLPGDGVEIPARVFSPPGTSEVTIVFFHGGGWIAGDLETHLQHARRLCVGVPARVISVDYRLAPEAPFPAAFDDCLAAARYAAATYGGPIIAAGDSAGGQLAASVAIAFRDEAIPLAGQLLIVPVTDLRGGYEDPALNARYPSRAELSEGYGLTLEGMATFTSLYAADADDWRASPIVADLRGVAPAIVHTAGCDPLQDEGRAFVSALRAADVLAVHHHWPGLNHGFFGLGGVSELAERAADQAVQDLRTLLESG